MPSLPLRLSSLAVVGLTQPEEGDWSAVRGLQYARLRDLTVMRVVMHAIAAIITIGIYLTKVPTALLTAWMAGLLIALWVGAKVDRSLAGCEKHGLTAYEFYRHAASVFLISVLWAIPLLLFAPHGSQADHLALWTLIAMLMAGSAAAMASAPIITIIFGVLTGCTAAFTFAVSGDWIIALVVLNFVAISIYGAVNAGKTYLAARLAEEGVAQKSEVVSLLLREYEDNEADWLWELDTSRRIRAASRHFAFATGRAASELEGELFTKLLAGDSWESGEFAPSLHQLSEKFKLKEHFSNLVVKADLPKGRRWWKLSGAPMIDDDGRFTGYRGVGSDVTVQRESDEKIAYMARYDTLTGLPNRLQLTECLGEALHYSEQWRSRCAFLMVDLDRFKSINDSLGHQIGDQLLAQVSDRLRDLMAGNDSCGRLGGDEFAVVMRDMRDRAQVEAFANRLILSLSEPYTVNQHKLFVGASVGSAIGPGDGATVETLMRNADLALYRAKATGGAAHRTYVPSLHADAEERRQLEVSLRHALERKEFRLNFQPVVHAMRENVVSFEALLRWHSADHGVVSPAKFIPLAEETRLIVPIGNWVLYEACREAVNWPSQMRVAVNVSGEQLLVPDFSRNVADALIATGLPPERLEIEVTESIFLRDPAMARQSLQEILALGCSIALDDFGTGYSSLGYIRNLSFSTIKIDRSFVQGAAQNNPESLAIIRAVVAMAQSLGMNTTAEGVENADEAAMVRELGCSKIQGYHFGRPMEAEDAARLLSRLKHSTVI
nr:EAL domain-containing protein [Altericroceibacterium endophyticum]